MHFITRSENQFVSRTEVSWIHIEEYSSRTESYAWLQGRVRKREGLLGEPGRPHTRPGMQPVCYSLLKGVAVKDSGPLGPAVLTRTSASPAQAPPFGGLFTGALADTFQASPPRPCYWGPWLRQYSPLCLSTFSHQALFPLPSCDPTGNKKQELFVPGFLAERWKPHLCFHLVLAWYPSVGRNGTPVSWCPSLCLLPAQSQ